MAIIVLSGGPHDGCEVNAPDDTIAVHSHYRGDGNDLVHVYGPAEGSNQADKFIYQGVITKREHIEISVPHEFGKKPGKIFGIYRFDV